MQVILLERVAKLGQMGDVVDVKPGFARNYLLLQGKALTASKENIAKFEQQKAQLEARNLETKQEAEALANKLGGQQFVLEEAVAAAGFGVVVPGVGVAHGSNVAQAHVRIAEPEVVTDAQAQTAVRDQAVLAGRVAQSRELAASGLQLGR